MPSLEDYGQLLDSLYIQLLDLIEQHTACRINIEKLSNSGQLLLAKTRYVQGSQTVSCAQIPTENSSTFKALCHVVTVPNKDRVSQIEFKLQRTPVSKNDAFVDPMHWFAILTPSSLRLASEQFKKCIDLVVESANIQTEILSVINCIEKLKLKRVVSQ